MRGLTGKRAIVTGGGSGIGRATALRLAEEGCTVGIFDIDQAGAETTVALCGGHARAWRTDIADRASVEQSAAAFEQDIGPPDLLANVAGWERPMSFLDTDTALWDKIIGINLYGPLHMHHVVVRGMAERGFGRVVNVASDAGRVGSSGEAVYSACPGPTDTPLFDAFKAGSPGGAKIGEALARAIPMRRIGTPEDYPGIIAFLLSDDAAYMTGQTISVSGGLTMV